MLKKRDLHECHSLYNLMIDPAVYPYVRYKYQSYEQYLFTTKQLIVEEEQKTCISRTILNEMGHPIGTIELYNIVNRTGFLATWIGIPYFGQGYNQRAKESFFAELFLEHEIETVYLKIRKQNIRSKKAVEKLPYARLANDLSQEVYQLINQTEEIYDLYQVERACFLENSAGLQQDVAT
ncbi:Protein N-acetyltransferase, RimJ/RimL family [Paenibacillus catalpae]|uniref:Protein N-acetyltransferase, RimJ/RimL family n=1 Tax=Paenibacillus catalpae TaxID=1045775 RepID=A0A1I2C315_9BACL|nr:GNAT family protein [Paenibacillus catalpae]SFE61990.1 Protein N-acetyltransferase, RimJ/RimL family [Paenibacillus catalpae]